MEEFDFNAYASRFMTDAHFGDLLFYKNYTYKNLIKSALVKADELRKCEDQFLALQLESSYLLFVYLLAGLFAKKDILILSHKEPRKAVENYQRNIGFTKIIKSEIFPTDRNSSHLIDVDMNRPVFYILSSGSSGPSKAIPLTLNNVYHSAQSVIDFFHMTEKDSTFLNLPHHHIGGLMILWRAFFSQSSVTINEDDPYQFISLVPLQVKRFLAVPKKKKKLQACRGVLIGGAPVDRELTSLLEEARIPYFETYGMSETCSLVMLNGVPLNGQEINLDQSGHFLIRGKTLSPSVAVDEDGFFHTKDIGKKLFDGRFQFKHRSDILFKSAGEMIDPLSIESAVKKIPWIAEAVVVPIQHPEWTFASCLVYKSLDENKNEQDIKDYLKTELHPYLIPRYFFHATKDLFIEGMKPRRFDIREFAQEMYFKTLFHYLYIPHQFAKKLVVFFHGFMEDHTDMIPLMDHHKEISYLLVDLPGHGQTKIDGFKNRESVFSELMSLILFYKKNHELILYGYSMGGRIALEIARVLHPELLILESAHFGLTSDEDKKNRMEADRKLLSDPQLDLEAFFRDWYQNPIFGSYNKSSHFNAAIKAKLQHSPHEWQKSLEFFSPGVSPTFYSIDQKIIGIVGSEDKRYKTHYEENALRMPGLDLNVVEGSGHNPHKTHLSEVKGILNRALI
jgi:O-succinylbenzoic acid--CoA ligase